MFELKERDDALRYAVNVDRVGAVVKISDCTVLAEKMVPVKLQAAPNATLELRGLGVPANRLQRAEVISGVEVVNPML